MFITENDYSYYNSVLGDIVIKIPNTSDEFLLNIRDLCKLKVLNNYDLFTSDMGYDCHEDFNNNIIVSYYKSEIKLTQYDLHEMIELLEDD